MDLSLGFLFCSIDLCFCLCASTILSWWLWLCSRAWSQVGWFLQFHSSFLRFLWLFKVFLYFHTNCEIICSSSVKNTIGSLIGIAFIAALFIIARTWKQPRCPSADEWIRKLWYIYTMDCYSAIKKNTFESVLMRWMKLEPIIQSEVSQKEKH